MARDFISNPMRSPLSLFLGDNLVLGTICTASCSKDIFPLIGLSYWKLAPLTPKTSCTSYGKACGCGKLPQDTRFFSKCGPARLPEPVWTLPIHSDICGRHCENFWTFTGPRIDFGLILLISNMIIHRSFTSSPTHLLSANVQGLVSFAVSDVDILCGPAVWAPQCGPAHPPAPVWMHLNWSLGGLVFNF